MSENTLNLSCSKCGAKQTYSPGQSVLKCEFCGAETEIPREENILAEVEESDYIVPLTVDKKNLESVTQSYMVTGEFTPDDILEKAIITKQWLHYVPTYLFSGSYDASWTATFGYDRTEHYTEYVTKYDNGRSWKEPVTKTKTVTDWRPMNGSDTGDFVVQVYAGIKLDARAVNLIEDASLKDKLTGFKSDYLIGFEIEKYEIREKDAYSNSAQSTVNSIIDRSVKTHGQGDRQRDWHWTANIDKTTEKVLMPVAHSIFEYGGKEYHVWIDGSDQSRMVGDNLPVDENKKKAANKGFIPLGVVITTIIGALVLEGDIFNWMTFIALILTAAYAGLRKKQMVDYSKTIRQAMLLQKQAASTNTVNMSDEDKTALTSTYQKPKLPIFADTSKDKFYLSGLSIAGVLFVLLPLINFSSSNSVTAKPENEAVVAPQSSAQNEQSPVTSEVQQAQSNDMSPQAIELYNKASDAYERKEYDKALTLLEVARGVDPNSSKINQAIEVVKRAQLQALQNMQIR